MSLQSLGEGLINLVSLAWNQNCSLLCYWNDGPHKRLVAADASLPAAARLEGTWLKCCNIGLLCCVQIMQDFGQLYAYHRQACYDRYVTLLRRLQAHFRIDEYDVRATESVLLSLFRIAYVT